MKPRYLGISVFAVSIIVLSMLFYFNNFLNQQNYRACIKLCESQVDSSCALESCLLKEEHNNGEKFILIIGLLVAFLAGVGFYLSLTKAEKIIEQKEYDLSKLNSEEKKVFFFIRENKDNGVYQSNIVEHFNFLKSKVSRILDKLEQVGIIERKRRGMTNIIFLK